MAFRPLIAPFVLFLMLCQHAGAASPPDKLDRLLSNSPFGQFRPGAVVNNGGNEPLEFRGVGVLEENGNRMFSIYETGTRRSNWVELNDPMNGFTVKGYNSANETLTVEYQDKSLTLAIKRAAPVPQVAQGPMPGGVGPGPGGAVAGPGGQLIQPVPGSVDQQRLQQIQEEIRRRRALRQQAVQPGGAGVPEGSPQMLPPNPAYPQSGPQMIPPNPGNPQSGPQMIPSNPSNPQPGQPPAPAKP